MAVVRSLLNRTEGDVATYVPIAKVLRGSGCPMKAAKRALTELYAKRYVYIRGDHVAASKPAIEFAMDWSNVPRLLRAILNSAGHISRPAELEVVIVASGLPHREVNTLLAELSRLGFAGKTYNGERELGRLKPYAYITAKGWDYLMGINRAPIASTPPDTAA